MPGQGLIQFQPFVPDESALSVFGEILSRSRARGFVPYLGVLKRHRPDPFWLTHAVDGWSLALDYKVTPSNRNELFAFCRSLAELVFEARGRFYFAKDLILPEGCLARMFPAERLEAFFRSVDDPPQWQVVTGVTGLASNQPPFDLGPCRFEVMDEHEYRLWGRRRQCGRYDPPPDTAPYFGPTEITRQLVGNWVARVSVRAIDGPHARAKAKVRLEALPRGAMLVVLLDDPRGVRDLPRAAEAEGYAVDGPTTGDGATWRLVIQV